MQEAENSPERVRERKKAERMEKMDNKLLNEIFNKPVTRKRNLQLQEILQHIEYYGAGRYVRAMESRKFLQEFKEMADNGEIRGDMEEFKKRLRFLEKMSYRRGSPYEYKWDNNKKSSIKKKEIITS